MRDNAQPGCACRRAGPRIAFGAPARTALEWEQLFGERVPCAAVRPIEDMFDHPQVLAEDLVATLDHPQVGRYRAMKQPIKFTGIPGTAPTPAPTFGQHSDEILAGCGYSAAEIMALRQRRVVP